MCGIAGWIDCRRLCDSAAIMRRMAQTMVPRGPDSGGFYTDDNCALAHRRLSVIDPARSAQPMTRKTALDSYTIVYNGELYNTAEIRSELESTGISFTSSGDTEVLLWAYITWGEACLDKLNGIYAFAVWQEKEKQLFLARDRIGVKPLFYYEYAGGLIFASEIKTLLAHPMIEPVIDRDGIAQIMLLGPARKPGSGIFKGIRELRPAECAMYCRCGLRKRTYWSLHALPHKETAEETEQHIAYLLTDAIKRQLVSDVPLCTMLSGGLDSSIISAVAAREFEQSGRQLTTYSIDYKDNEKNFHSSKFQPDMDAPWIRKMSAFIGSKHINVEVDTPALTDALELSTYAVTCREWQTWTALCTCSARLLRAILPLLSAASVPMRSSAAIRGITTRKFSTNRDFRGLARPHPVRICSATGYWVTSTRMITSTSAVTKRLRTPNISTPTAARTDVCVRCSC